VTKGVDLCVWLSFSFSRADSSSRSPCRRYQGVRCPPSLPVLPVLPVLCCALLPAVLCAVCFRPCSLLLCLYPCPCPLLFQPVPPLSALSVNDWPWSRYNGYILWGSHSMSTAEQSMNSSKYNPQARMRDKTHTHSSIARDTIKTSQEPCTREGLSWRG
jgi:hypothetical protein